MRFEGKQAEWEASNRCAFFFLGVGDTKLTSYDFFFLLLVDERSEKQIGINVYMYTVRFFLEGV